ncbi:N-acylneuraminate-9-phosphatase-like [Ptychodera flava]|uniref:N-acylneuraminate-9-phosphatase-like n=1 Tax=Ptychodera flava TaxID=63121 RepID=UPI003969CC2F
MAASRKAGNDANIKLLIFDLDNTLVDTKRADKLAFEEVKNFLQKECPNLDVDGVVSLFRKYVTEAEVDPEEKISVDEWRTHLWGKAIGNGYVSSNGLDKQVYSKWKEMRLKEIFFTEEVKDLLVRLRQKYKLTLMTNGDSTVQHEKVAVCSAEEYFDSIIVSGDYPHAKPHPSIYEVAFKQFSVLPSECVMIGDSLKTDIEGGLNSGLFATVWINPNSAEPSGFDPEPCYSIPSVLLLEGVLTNMHSKKSNQGPNTWEVNMMNVL